MATPYSRGYSFELKAKKHLEELGYTVFRVAGSHGPADLIALSGYQEQSYTKKIIRVWFIQCQRSKYFSKAKKLELEELASKVNAQHTLAWNADGRKRGNSGIAWSDDNIIHSVPKPLRAEALGG